MTPRPLEEYEFLSGTGVLAEGAQEKCLSGDQFLISRRQLQVENPAWWFSRRLQYSDLSARIADDLSARFGFKSMAYEDEDDYALSGHTHSEYNYVRLVSPFADSPDSEYDKVLLVSIDGKRKWVKVPRQRIMPPPDPVPGQIKLMAVTSLQPIDAMGRNFDGWVYADGQTYPPVFEHASYFEQVDGGFRVPDMRNMFEMNNRPYEDVGFGLKDAENDVSPHAHNMALKFTQNPKVKMSFKVGNWQNQKNKGSHIVTSNQKFRDFKLYISLKGMKIDYGPESVSIVQGQGETMPETDMLPVLIYIGKRTGA